MERILKFDVMLDQRWVATMTMPILPWYITDYVDGLPVIDEGVMKRFAEERRPSLIGKDYKIYLCGKPQFRD